MTVSLATLKVVTNLSTPSRLCCPSLRHTSRCARRVSARQRPACWQRAPPGLTMQPAGNRRPPQCAPPRRASWQLEYHLQRAEHVSPGARRAPARPWLGAALPGCTAAAEARKVNAPAILLLSASNARPNLRCGPRKRRPSGAVRCARCTGEQTPKPLPSCHAPRSAQRAAPAAAAHRAARPKPHAARARRLRGRAARGAPAWLEDWAILPAPAARAPRARCAAAPRRGAAAEARRGGAAAARRDVPRERGRVLRHCVASLESCREHLSAERSPLSLPRQASAW
jgi:hypothetical protein